MLASTTSGVLSSDHWDAAAAVADTAALRETSAIAVADSGVAGGRGQRKFESSRIQKEKSIRWNG